MKIRTLLTEKLTYIFFISYCLYWIINNFFILKFINYPIIFFTAFLTYIMLKNKHVLGLITGVLIFILIILSFLTTSLDTASSTVTTDDYQNKLIIYYLFSGISLFMSLYMAIVNYRKLQSA